jgi:hypothetical protein
MGLQLRQITLEEYMTGKHRNVLVVNKRSDQHDVDSYELVSPNDVSLRTLGEGDIAILEIMPEKGFW